MNRLLLLMLFYITSLYVKGQQHIDSLALSELMKKSELAHSDGLAIYFNGEVILEKYSNNEDKLVHCYSLEKSLINLCIGKLVTDGKIQSIDSFVYNYFPEWKQPLKEKITIRHLLTHTSGLEEPANIDYWNAPNIIQYALCSNAQEMPGDIYKYSTKATFILHGLIEKISGSNIELYMANNIFEPLGIKNYRWDYDSVGNPKLLYMTAGDLLKIGQLILNKGKWFNLQLISENWFLESFESSQKQEPEYGMLWWIIPESKQYIINDSLIERFKSKGIDTTIIRKYITIKGSYNSYGDFLSKISQAFGDNWQVEFDKKIYPFTNRIYIKTISKKILGYEANGWIGQYLVIDPEKRLIAARMVKQKETYNAQTDAWFDFRDYVYKLVKEK